MTKTNSLTPKIITKKSENRHLLEYWADLMDKKGVVAGFALGLKVTQTPSGPVAEKWEVYTELRDLRMLIPVLKDIIEHAEKMSQIMQPITPQNNG